MLNDMVTGDSEDTFAIPYEGHCTPRMLGSALPVNHTSGIEPARRAAKCESVSRMRSSLGISRFTIVPTYTKDA